MLARTSPDEDNHKLFSASMLLFLVHKTRITWLNIN